MKITLLLFFLFSSIVLPQELKKNFFDPTENNYGLLCRVIGEEAGLNTNEIKDFIVDEDGFMWIVTDQGLARWDGESFKYYDEKNYPFLENVQMKSIKQGIDGTLYISANPPSVIQIKEGLLTYYIEPGKLNLDVIIVMVIDESNNLWFGSLEGELKKYNGTKLISYGSEKGLVDKGITELYLDDSNHLYAGTGNGNTYQLQQDIFIPSVALSKSKNGRVKSIFRDSQNRLWVGTTKGLSVYKNDKKIDLPLLNTLNNNLILAIDEDKDGNIWIATYSRGIFIFNGEKLYQFSNQNGLSDLKLTSLKIIDDAVWVGTYTGGLNEIKNTAVHFISKKEGLDVEFVNCLFEDADGSILIGTLNGIYRLKDKNSPQVKKLDILTDKHIYAIQRDLTGNLLIGTRLAGLFVLENNKLANYSTSNGLTSNFIRSIFIDDNGAAWIGTNSGGVCILENRKFKYLDNTNGLSNNLVSFIHKTMTGDYWIGTSGGGVTIVKKDGGIQIINEESGLSGNVISYIYENNDGSIWLTINGGGVTKIDNGRIYNFTVDRGLPTNKIVNIQKDGYNKFWFGSRTGIFSVDESEFQKCIEDKSHLLESSSLGKSDGMLTDRCTGASSQTSLNVGDYLFFSTFQGAAIIKPDALLRNNSNINIHIDEAILDGNGVNNKNRFVVPPNHSRLEFVFTAIALNNPGNINYKYKLDNFDKEWINSFDSKKAVYTHLNYGSYTFNVFAYDEYSESKSSIAKITFYVEPYLWETWWFQFIAGAFAVSLIFILAKGYSSRKYKRRLKVLEAEKMLEQERIRISRDMHDELGSSITKLGILTELAIRDVKNEESLKEKLIQISDGGHELASTMDEIVWAVNPTNDRLNKLIYYTVQFAEDYLALAEIEVNIDIPQDLPEKFVSAEARHNIFLVIKEAANNIVKHSKADKAKIKVKYSDDKTLEIILEDNGTGADFTSLDQFGNGLKNMKKRIEDLGGAIEFDNLKNGGFALKLKLQI